MEPCLPDDLSDLESRLSGWRPCPDDLHADRMLYAAGRASARAGRVRLIWPALTGCLAVLAVVLGIGLVRERAERLALARQLQARPAEPSPILPPPDSSGEKKPIVRAPAASWLAARQALARDPDAWPALEDPAESPGPADGRIETVWSRNTPFDP